MQTKTTKPASKQQKMKSIRVQFETQEKADRILKNANKKRMGRKIKADQLLKLALDLVTDEHIVRLQDQSLSNEDRKEILRQAYIKMRGEISRDDFTGFMMMPEFQEFLKEHNSGQGCEKPFAEVAAQAG